MKNVINSVVANDLCIGCGMCTYKNEDSLEMGWNEQGFLVPSIKNKGIVEFDLEVCPFNPNPEENVRTENEISQIFLKDAPNYHSRIGRYTNTYIGSAPNLKKVSSSGGIATFVFATLLESRKVDYIISVREAGENFYDYEISSSIPELMLSSKTKYYPVTLATILSEIIKLEGTVAVSGVACFIKSLRLAQHYHPELKGKIKFLVGIICGGIKSKFFTEYLASKTGVKNGNFHNPQYRIKDFSSTANDYSFGCTETSTEIKKEIKMRQVGDMWGTGLFKANACDFCDDVTTELADISLGDAWLQPYVNDGSGTSVIVTRSLLAEELINSAMENKKLDIELMPLDDFLISQRGSFNHRQDSLPFRMKIAENNGQSLPPKRFIINSLPFTQKIVQLLRLRIRSKSLHVWRKYPNAKRFDKLMKGPLFILKIATLSHHKIRKYINI